MRFFYKFFFVVNVIICLIILVRSWYLGNYGIFLFWEAGSKLSDFFDTTYVWLLFILFISALILQIPAYLFSESFSKDSFFRVFFRWAFLFCMFVFNKACSYRLSDKYWDQIRHNKVESDPYLCIGFCNKFGGGNYYFARNEKSSLSVFNIDDVKANNFVNGHWYLFKCDNNAHIAELLCEASFCQRMYIANDMLVYSKWNIIDKLKIYDNKEYKENFVARNLDAMLPKNVNIVSTIVTKRDYGICYFTTPSSTDEIWTCRNFDLKNKDSVLIAYSDNDHRKFDIYEINPSKEKFEYCDITKRRNLSDSIFLDKKMHTKKSISSLKIKEYYPKTENGIFINGEPMDETFTFVSIEMDK